MPATTDLTAALPSIEAVIDQTVALGRLTNSAIRCVAISLNTSDLNDADAEAELAATEARLGLPTADPMRAGTRFERVLDACAV